MAQHRADAGEADAGAEHGGGGGMAQHMRAAMRAVHAGALDRLRHDAFDGLAADGTMGAMSVRKTRGVVTRGLARST